MKCWQMLSLPENSVLSRKQESDSSDLPVGCGETTSRFSGVEILGTCFGISLAQMFQGWKCALCLVGIDGRLFW